MKRKISVLFILVLTINISFSQEFQFKKEISSINKSFSERYNFQPKNTLSPAKAFFLSFLVPGLGEHFIGKKGISPYLIFTEVSLWIGVIGTNMYAGWLEDDYRAFAANHAGVINADKTDRYYVNIGNFMNIYDYNAKKRFDRDNSLVYDEDGNFYWQWDSKENREKVLRIGKEGGEKLSCVGKLCSGDGVMLCKGESRVDVTYKGYEHVF